MRQTEKCNVEDPTSTPMFSQRMSLKCFEAILQDENYSENSRLKDGSCKLLKILSVYTCIYTSSDRYSPKKPRWIKETAHGINI